MKIKLSDYKQAEVSACLDKLESIALKTSLTFRDQDDIKLAVAILRDRLFNGLSKREQKAVSKYVKRGNSIANENARAITADLAEGWLGEASRTGHVDSGPADELIFGANWKQPEPKLEDD